MTNKIIADTNVLVGLYDEKDVWNRQARRLMEEMRKASVDLVLLDCVANEVFTVLARRLREGKRQENLIPIFRKLKTDLSKDKITNSYQLIEINYNEIIDIIVESKGKINFHDALIITFAFSQNISFIASFDTNFDGITGITRLFDPIASFK
jgi:predicted nucleic acid-binding protein